MNINAKAAKPIIGYCQAGNIACNAAAIANRVHSVTVHRSPRFLQAGTFALFSALKVLLEVLPFLRKNMLMWRESYKASQLQERKANDTIK